MANPVSVTLNIEDGKPAAVIGVGTVAPGFVVIEVDTDDIQGDVNVTIEKIKEVIREQLF